MNFIDKVIQTFVMNYGLLLLVKVTQGSIPTYTVDYYGLQGYVPTFPLCIGRTFAMILFPLFLPLLTLTTLTTTERRILFRTFVHCSPVSANFAGVMSPETPHSNIRPPPENPAYCSMQIGCIVCLLGGFLSFCRRCRKKEAKKVGGKLGKKRKTVFPTQHMHYIEYLLIMYPEGGMNTDRIGSTDLHTYTGTPL